MAKKLNPYILYPLVLGCVCLVCGGALATLNFATKDQVAINVEKKANEAIYKIAKSANEVVKEYTTTDVALTDSDQKKLILEKKKVTMESNVEYLYYKLITPKGYTGKVTFGAMVELKNFSVIGTRFIDATEDDIGVKAAKALEISTDNPFVSGGKVTSSATAKKTLPVIGETLEVAIADAKASGGIVVKDFPTKGTALEQLQFMWKNDLNQDTDITMDSVTDVTTAALAINIDKTTESKVDTKWNFKFNSKDASFYVISFTQINIEGDVDDGKFAAIANEAGIIDYQFISGSGMLRATMRSFNGKVSVDTPYTSLSSFDTITGATTDISNQLMTSALSYILTDFGGNK